MRQEYASPAIHSLCNLFQKRLHANFTVEEEKDDNFTLIEMQPESRRKNVLTDEMKNMMVELLKKRQRQRRSTNSLNMDASGQTIETCLSYAELWSLTSERDALDRVGDWLCEEECRAKDVGKVAGLVSGILSKRLLMSLRWEKGSQGMGRRESCQCQYS